MPARNRIMGIVVGAVALGLTVTGVVIAATDNNPGQIARDPLVLNGYPPQSAQLHLTVTSGTGAGVSANVDVHFDNDEISGVVQVPLLVSTAALDVRALHGHVFVRPADESSGSWLSVKERVPSLFGLALEMTKPDIDLISGFSSETIFTSGYSTTHIFVRHDVAVANVFGGSATKVGSLTWSITTGSQGEVSQSTLVVKDASASTTISLTVLSYNHGARIVAPATGDVTPVSIASVEKELIGNHFMSILLPTSLSSLGNVHVS